MSTANAYDLLIIGQGAAAFAAALYAARYQVKPVVIGETFGGETATGGMIENYPGYPEIDGFDLMLKFREQADKYEVPVIDDKVVSVEGVDGHYTATTFGGETYVGASVLLAVGRERRKLGLEHEEEWTGKGVSFCSTCDAPLHRGNVVAVVGGGDAAIKGAVLLTRYAQKVYVIYRGSRFTRPEPANLRALGEANNAETLFETNVVALKGEDSLSGIVLDRGVRWLHEDCGARHLPGDRRRPAVGACGAARGGPEREGRGRGGQADGHQRAGRLCRRRPDGRVGRAEADDHGGGAGGSGGSDRLRVRHRAQRGVQMARGGAARGRLGGTRAARSRGPTLNNSRSTSRSRWSGYFIQLYIVSGGRPFGYAAARSGWSPRASSARPRAPLPEARWLTGRTPLWRAA